MIPVVRALRGTTLQWWAGLLCAAIGAQLLIVPHQVNSLAYDALRPNSAAWGVVALSGGMLLLVVAIVGGARRLQVVAHLGVGGIMLLLSSMFGTSGAWFGAIVFGALGAATLNAPWLARASRNDPAASSDLFTIAMCFGLGVVGIAIEATPGAFVMTGYDRLAPYQHWHGASLVVASLLAIWAQLDVRTPRWASWPAVLVLVGIGVLPMFARAFTQGIWTGITLHGICTIALLSAPWLGPRLDRIDPRSLNTRLAMTLAISSAVALITIVTIDANREESSLRSQASASQQTLATALGHDVADYVELHEAAARALAAGPGLLDRSAEEQTAWLRAYSAAYPNVVVFSTFDRDGQQLARSDGRPLSAVANSPWFERVRTTLRPVRVVTRSTSIQRPIFGYAAPVRGPDGTFRGIVGATVESTRIADQLRRVVADPNQRAYLVDSQGRTIAHPDVTLIASFASLADRQPVAALLGGDARAGSLLYTEGRDEWLAGYARVPGLEWGVVVEQPTRVALASVRTGRERAFAASIVVVCAAAIVGSVAAGWLTAPLASLAVAVRRLADGASDTQLSRSGVTEIARLADIFVEMRERLAARTLEHERSERALRASALDNARLYAEAQAAIRARDEFLSIASHELRTPVTGIKGFAQLLLRAQERNRLDPARLTRALHAIDDATDRLTPLTQDLLDVSRIRLGQLPLRLQEIDLADLVRRVSERFADQLPNTHELRVEVGAAVPSIAGDADRLEHVLSNLLENATKYSPGGGLVEVRLACGDGEIVLTVRDEGIGLPIDATESIFQPFGRAPNATPGNLPGMGLGLYICRNIVERHGGRIVARSAGEGHGTRVEITLPCAAPGAPDVLPHTPETTSEALPA